MIKTQQFVQALLVLAANNYLFTPARNRGVIQANVSWEYKLAEDSPVRKATKRAYTAKRVNAREERERER